MTEDEIREALTADQFEWITLSAKAHGRTVVEEIEMARETLERLTTILATSGTIPSVEVLVHEHNTNNPVVDPDAARAAARAAWTDE